MTRRETVSETIVQKVAACEGVDPTDLAPALYDVVDPDALENLFQPLENGSEGRTGVVEFTYEKWVVTVDSEDRVRVEPITEATRTDPSRSR